MKGCDKSPFMAKKTDQKKRLVLLDAHAILHRAYHALPDFTSGKGEPTGALYGLSTMLIKIINDLRPDYIAACYDLPGPTFRHEAYKEYKALRKKAEDDLVAQMKSSRNVFTAFNVPIYEAPGFEADDVLGTIAEQMKSRKDISVIIASGDMDTLQLVDNDRVTVFTLRKGIQDTVTYNEKAVFDRFGFLPKLLPDYKGLRGDPSDNIIGIKGIGEKSAEELIKHFGTLEAIYKKLKKDEKQFIAAGIKPRMIELLKNGEDEALFSKTLATIRKDAPVAFSIPSNTWKETLDIKKIASLFDELGFRSLRARVDSLFDTQAEKTQAKTQTMFSAPPEMDFKETAVALWLLDSNITNPTLDDILNYGKTEDFYEARKTIFETLARENLTSVFESIEKPLVPIVKKMGERGITIDVSYLKKLSVEYHKELNLLQKKIYQLAGVEFNINSPKQLSEILFEKLGLTLKNHKKTGGGVKSTRESELEKMKPLHPIIAEILSYRELQKLLSTYIDNIPQMIRDDGRLHAEFLQAGAATGRMASQNPGLQNIPIKTELGKKIRNGFVATEGFVLAAFDYSQIELRIAAFLSGDEKLLTIFREGRDVHAEVAAQVFGVSRENVTSDMRRQAKVINFGILYGMGVRALQENLGSDRETAQKFYNSYFETFSTLAAYLDRVRAEAARKGYTTTFFGRRRQLEGIRSSIPYIKAAAERMAINAPIQGTQADVIKQAMVKIDDHLTSHSLHSDVFLLLQVHDELIYEVKKEKLLTVSKEIQKIMESILPPEKIGGIALTANFLSGNNWGELH